MAGFYARAPGKSLDLRNGGHEHISFSSRSRAPSQDPLFSSVLACSQATSGSTSFVIQRFSIANPCSFQKKRRVYYSSFFAVRGLGQCSRKSFPKGEALILVVNGFDSRVSIRINTHSPNNIRMTHAKRPSGWIQAQLLKSRKVESLTFARTFDWKFSKWFWSSIKYHGFLCDFSRVFLEELPCGCLFERCFRNVAPRT